MASEHEVRLLNKPKLEEMVKEVDHNERLDEDVQELLYDVADDFVDSVTSFACMLAKHRKSKRLEAKDLSLHLEKAWNIKIASYGPEEVKIMRRSLVTDAHKQRLALIKKNALPLSVANKNRNTKQAAGGARPQISNSIAKKPLKPNVPTPSKK